MRGRFRSDAQALACLGQAAHLRWRSRGQIDRVSLFGTAKGARPVDVTPAGRQGCGTEHRCPGQRQHDRADVKKNILKPHLKEQFVIPPAANAAFVAAMEDILEVYHRPHDPEYPVVCLDETSKQLMAETRVPIDPRGMIMSMSATGPPICSCCSRRWKAGGMSRSRTAIPRWITHGSSRNYQTS